MSEPRLLHLPSPGADWDRLELGFGGPVQIAAGVDPRSMREVRAAVVEAAPDIVVYGGYRARSATDAVFEWCAEATIGVAAAALEAEALLVFVSHPDVGARTPEATPCPISPLGEGFEKGEQFATRAMRGRCLVVRPPRAEVEAASLGRLIRRCFEAGQRGPVPLAAEPEPAEARAEVPRAPEPAGAEARTSSSARAWAGEDPEPGLSVFGHGLCLLRLVPGQRERLEHGALEAVLRAGKVVLELADGRDRVLRSGERFEVPLGAHLVALDPSELWLVAGR